MHPSLEENFHQCVQSLQDPDMVTQLFYCGSLERPDRIKHIFSTGFTEEGKNKLILQVCTDGGDRCLLSTVIRPVISLKPLR